MNNQKVKIFIYIQHYLIFTLFDCFLFNMLKNWVFSWGNLVGLAIVNLLCFFLVIYLRSTAVKLIVLAKLGFLGLYFSSALEVSFILKVVAWFGFYFLYMYHLVLELGEAYFNSNFSKYDISIKNDQVTCLVDGLNDEFSIITNMTHGGFYAKAIKRQKGFNQGLNDFVITIDSSRYPVSGKVVQVKDDGFGVMVVKSKIWDKLYVKVKKLKIMENL